MDYAEVSKEVFRDSKNNPAKAALYLSLGGVITAFVQKCPSIGSYRSELIEYSNELGLCGEMNRNQQTKVYVEEASSLLNHCCVQCWNLGVCSLLVRRSCSSNCQNYQEICKYLKPQGWSFSQVIDIGVWNQWLFLTRKMVDFDVNTSEFSEE